MAIDFSNTEFDPEALDEPLVTTSLTRRDENEGSLRPQTLREYAGLGRDVVITGSSNKAKIWDKETWERRSAPQLDPAKVADMFDMLGL